MRIGWASAIIILLLAPITHAAFRVVLVDPYGVYGEERSNGVVDCDLVRFSSTGSSVPYSLILNRVAQVGSQVGVIFGQTERDYFLFDTRDQTLTAKTFADRDLWLAALAEAGISDLSGMKTPGMLVVGVPDERFAPWRYRMMGGRFGWADETWSLAIQLLGLAVAFILGVLAHPELLRPAISSAAVFGLLINFIAQHVIMGEGPGFCVGMVVLPAFFALAAAAGNGLRRFLQLGWARR